MAPLYCIFPLTIFKTSIVLLTKQGTNRNDPYKWEEIRCFRTEHFHHSITWVFPWIERFIQKKKEKHRKSFWESAKLSSCCSTCQWCIQSDILPISLQSNNMFFLIQFYSVKCEFYSDCDLTHSTHSCGGNEKYAHFHRGTHKPQPTQCP